MRGDADKNLKRKSRGLKKKKDAEEKGHEGLGTHVTGKTETREEKGGKKWGKGNKLENAMILM